MEQYPFFFHLLYLLSLFFFHNSSPTPDCCFWSWLFSTRMWGPGKQLSRRLSS
jgi:hypothetical protein